MGISKVELYNISVETLSPEEGISMGLPKCVLFERDPTAFSYFSYFSYYLTFFSILNFSAEILRI